MTREKQTIFCRWCHGATTKSKAYLERDADRMEYYPCCPACMNSFEQFGVASYQVYGLDKPYRYSDRNERL